MPADNVAHVRPCVFYEGFVEEMTSTGDTAAKRFGVIRSIPPAAARQGVDSSQGWKISQLGDHGEYPNGGLWRFAASDVALIVKRTGSEFLGGDPIWRLSVDDADPQWWGRESAFYRSNLGTGGWSDSCSAATCFAVDEGESGVDLWLEEVGSLPLPLSRYEDAVVGLATWQGHWKESTHSVLSRHWIAQHVGRRQLDNDLTLHRPGWALLFEAGLEREVRHWAAERITDPSGVRHVLDRFTQLPTHHDFHHMNLGLKSEQVVIIDWATVGWGPVGHDVGNLVIDRAAHGDTNVVDLWDTLLAAYNSQLTAVGLAIPDHELRRAAAISTTIRMGWVIDFLLNNAVEDRIADLAPLIPVVNFLAKLHVDYRDP